MSPNTTTNGAEAKTSEALAALRERMPEMAEAAQAFVSLSLAANELVCADGAWPPGMELDAESFGAGAPLLSGLLNADFERLFLDSASLVIPAIRQAFPAVADQAALLGAALEKKPDLAPRCVLAAMSADRDKLEPLAEELGVQSPALGFLLQEVARPCLKRAAKRLGKLADDELWFKGHCPVCGSRPDMGWLKAKGDESEYLVSKAGRLWLHCAMCGHEWRFPRLVCPSCGQHDHELLEVLTARQRPDERIHVCKACKRYLPVTDLTGHEGPFDPEIAPLAMVPLDIAAREHGYSPMAKRPWNSFADNDQERR